MSKPDTRTAILDAAIEIMGQDGFDGLSASRLARAAGISKSSLFHHFASMDDVPLAAFERISHQIVAAEMPDNGSAADFIAAMGDAAFASLNARRTFYAAYVSFLTRAVFDPRLRDKVRASLDAAKAEVARAIAARLNDDAQARDLTNLTLAIMDGAMLHILVLEGEDDMRAMWARYIAMVRAQGAK